MNPSIPETMKAAAIDRFGGPEVIHTRSLPVPKPGEYEVLIQLDTAGIGVWDPYVREGEIPTGEQRFPRVIGNDGAGTVVAAGDRVTRFRIGERVYAYSMDGGFYAEYVAVNEDNVAPIPPGVEPDEAGALGADGITALRGLDDELRLQAGETLMIFGASGGIGHIAVQLAKRMGARVLAIASGSDGVDLVRRLGADAAVDGRHQDQPPPRGRSRPAASTPRWCWSTARGCRRRWMRSGRAAASPIRTASSPSRGCPTASNRTPTTAPRTRRRSTG